MNPIISKVLIHKRAHECLFDTGMFSPRMFCQVFVLRFLYNLIILRALCNTFSFFHSYRVLLCYLIFSYVFSNGSHKTTYSSPSLARFFLRLQVEINHWRETIGCSGAYNQILPPVGNLSGRFFIFFIPLICTGFSAALLLFQCLFCHLQQYFSFLQSKLQHCLL